MEKSDSASTGFPPVSGEDARVLILGSLPGQKSLQEVQYYAHPRNDFWPIMKQLLDVDGDYQQRCKGLIDSRIALWDVLASARRPGSLDASIDLSSAVPNDFASFFASHASIRLVCFNGRKAEALFRRFSAGALPDDVKTALLPSSSPAHATLTLKEKLSRWRGIIEPCL